MHITAPYSLKLVAQASYLGCLTLCCAAASQEPHAYCGFLAFQQRQRVWVTLLSCVDITD